MDQRSMDIGAGSQRLYSAFERVLLRLSDEHFQIFFNASPRVIFLPGSSVKVFAHDASALSMIYVDSRAVRDRKVRGGLPLADFLAHEIAHVVHGDHDVSEGSNADSEARADALAVSWGFQRSYSPARIRRLRRREREGARRAR